MMGDASTSGSSSAPLPPGWTSHISPAGRTYYHNASSGVSTYTLPKPKREKPVAKTLIPNTSGWLKVTTNKENVFYFHPDSKTSQWLPPQHVVAALKRAEEEELREKEKKRKEEEESERKEREEERREKLERKRKLEEGVPITEFDASKRARTEDDEDADEDEDDGSEAEEDEELVASEPHQYAIPAPSHQTEGVTDDVTSQNGDDEDDEEWQRQIAEQMAAEAEAEADAEENTAEPDPSEPVEVAAETNPEEARSSFMALLTSLNGTRQEINPMAPYDLEQPKVSHHASFLALPTHDREDIFNEWCKLRIREKRAAKAAASSSSSSATAATKASRADPSTAEANLLALLRDEVRSTRTKFSDFKAAFSRHPHFTSYGRSDADRERLFKQHLVQLGETKRLAAEKAERDFGELLSNRLPGNLRAKVADAEREGGREKVMEVWTGAKRPLVEDGRYDAVGSSSRRFELFVAWAKGERRSSSRPSHAPTHDANNAASTKADKDAARLRALRDREAAVRAEQQRLSRINRSAFTAASRSDSLLSFQQLLLDAIATPHLAYSEAEEKLARDARFDAPGLSDADRRRLFAEHVARLGEREEDRLARVFAEYAPGLDANAQDVVAQALHDERLACAPLDVYARDPQRLQQAYERWHQRRSQTAQRDFDAMLTESAFVDFWGRLKKASSSSSPTAAPNEGEEEGEETQSLLEMARKVDLHEIESVLRNDARYRAWKHEPETRRRWIRDHLERLAAPANSVHR